VYGVSVRVRVCYGVRVRVRVCYGVRVRVRVCYGVRVRVRVSSPPPEQGVRVEAVELWV